MKKLSKRIKSKSEIRKSRFERCYRRYRAILKKEKGGSLKKEKGTLFFYANF